MGCREVDGLRDEPKRAVGASGHAFGLPAAPNLAVFLGPRNAPDV